MSLIQTAQEINDRNRKPLTQEELTIIGNKLFSGRLILIRRDSVTCDVCSKEMWGQYIGHRDPVTEWIWKCECGNQLYSG